MMEYFAGLDVSLRSCAICVVDAKGKVMLEKELPYEVGDIADCLNSSGYLWAHPFLKGAELAQMPLEAALERELVLVGIGEACINELDLRHRGPFWRVAPSPRAEALQEGEVGKNPAGFALRDAECATSRQRRPPGRSAATAHHRPRIHQTSKSLI
ncbi:MAG: hypothetical protein ACKVKF_20010 [Rhodobacterales bacterium]